jgi:hypothetical protein
MVAPIQKLSDGLWDFFERPGMIAAVNQWKVRPGVFGEARTIQDGQVWNTLKDKDDERFFFGPGAAEEIRLGVTFSLDWEVSIFFYMQVPMHIRFGRKTSNYGPSHSSGVMSFCVQNLLESARYVFSTLLLSSRPSI